MKSGYITVYLSLVTGILLSLLLTVMEGVRMHTIRTQTECVMDHFCLKKYNEAPVRCDRGLRLYDGFHTRPKLIVERDHIPITHSFSNLLTKCLWNLKPKPVCSRF